MTNTTFLGGWVRRFLLEHLVGAKNLARNTQQSYRDTLRLLLPFIARCARKPLDRLNIEDLSVDRVRAFLSELEEKRSCAVATRNQRLAAIRSLARFVGMHSPEHVQWCGELCSIIFKKAPRPLVTYLEKDEMDALLAAPPTDTAQGRRDHALLLFLYNTGARADEVAHVRIEDLDLGKTTARDPSSVLIHGKGNKLRRCPLWIKTVNELLLLVTARPSTEQVFLNRRGEPLTRFGVHAWWDDMRCEWQRSCQRWQRSVSARTRSAIQRPHTCFVPASTSTRSALGSVTSHSPRPMCTQRLILR